MFQLSAVLGEGDDQVKVNAINGFDWRKGYAPFAAVEFSAGRSTIVISKADALQLARLLIQQDEDEAIDALARRLGEDDPDVKFDAISAHWGHD
jgi:hypothetical protein